MGWRDIGWRVAQASGCETGAQPFPHVPLAACPAGQKTTTTTTTAMPRHGICGIGRSYSSGGPPWTLSASVGGRKNKRGSRSMRLKLEVDEGITGSLCKNDGTRHQGPCRGYNPPWQTRYRGFDVDVAQRPMRKHHEKCYDADL